MPGDDAKRLLSTLDVDGKSGLTKEWTLPTSTTVTCRTAGRAACAGAAFTGQKASAMRKPTLRLRAD